MHTYLRGRRPRGMPATSSTRYHRTELPCGPPAPQPGLHHPRASRAEALNFIFPCGNSPPQGFLFSVISRTNNSDTSEQATREWCPRPVLYVAPPAVWRYAGHGAGHRPLLWHQLSSTPLLMDACQAGPRVHFPERQKVGALDDPGSAGGSGWRLFFYPGAPLNFTTHE